MSIVSAGMTTITLAAIQGLLVLGGVCLCLWLFFLLKRETQAAALECRERDQALQRALESLQKELDQARSELAAGRGPAGLPPLRLDLTRRAQVLRLHRNGQSSAQIASMLALPRGEVELLIKVHQLRQAADTAEGTQPELPARA
jgi:hypothetical protein